MEQFISETVFIPFELKLFCSLPRHFEQQSYEEDYTSSGIPSSRFHTIPVESRLTHGRYIVYQALICGESSVNSDFEARTR
ncbi:hypothetical protein AVEN_218162-1 [Araneus ventricosus]|uniref:Uncharacterized protein n=1 Tax=Araneus ventricosus TaxID=182803 RepID=A0A4Y2FSI1_ARAVE|nr:hypothetical protein AVEN_218162-1 [Araneus ventricosus]